MPDPLLLRGWTQWAYNEFCKKRSWSHLRAETAIVVGAQKTGTVTFTTGAKTITGGTLVFASTDVGRQIRISSIPIYTLVAVDTQANQATLQRVYSEPTTTTTATILDAYVTLPEDFHRFISILDPTNKWRLRFWVSQDTLNRWDPGRMGTGHGRVLASLGFSPVPGRTGCPQYELYPFQTGAYSYPVWYFRKPELLTDDQEIIGPLARRAQEVLLEGVLARCAMWPGTSGAKNPYFNLQLAAFHTKAFLTAIDEIDVQDEELYYEAAPLTEFAYADFPWDAAWLQTHEPYVIG
ncbi:MAG TPA: hypothetical protein VFO16_24175 [Pseudonocardiaceae bacterium]|nr:hypothetical protein [Pseudonocardiaceae bacterium]